MIFLLAIALILVLIIAFIMSKGDIFSPWVIITASFLNSTCLAMFNLAYWGYTFHLNTCLIILSGVILFGCGSLFGDYAFSGEKTLQFELDKFNIKTCYLTVVFSTLIVLCLSYFSFQDLYHLSMQYGNTEGYKNIVRTLRPLIEAQILHLPNSYSYRNLIATVFVYVFLAVGINRTIFEGLKMRNLIYLLPLCAYVPMMLLSTGRMAFLRVILFIIVISGILYQRKIGYSWKTTLKILIGVYCAMTIFFVCFFAAGHLTGKVITAERTPFIIISHYTGAQIPALDIQLNNYLWNDRNNVGEITLLGLYGNLRKLGLQLPDTSMFLPFIHLHHVTTNVYTSLFRYIHDYGVVGMWSIVFFLGILYTTFYNLIKYRYNSFSLLVIYSYICLPLFLFGHDELFLTGVILSRNVYLFIFMILLIKFLKLRRSKI